MFEYMVYRLPLAAPVPDGCSDVVLGEGCEFSKLGDKQTV